MYDCIRPRICFSSGPLASTISSISRIYCENDRQISTHVVYLVLAKINASSSLYRSRDLIAISRVRCRRLTYVRAFPPPRCISPDPVVSHATATATAAATPGDRMKIRTDIRQVRVVSTTTFERRHVLSSRRRLLEGSLERGVVGALVLPAAASGHVM